MYHNNTLNGYGRYYGAVQFEGDFVNGTSQGYGIQNDMEGVYMGQMHQGKRDGIGKYLYTGRKEIYEGEWKNDNKDGFGIEYYANEDRFGGGYKNGEKDEIGIIVGNGERVSILV